MSSVTLGLVALLKKGASSTTRIKFVCCVDVGGAVNQFRLLVARVISSYAENGFGWNTKKNYYKPGQCPTFWPRPVLFILVTILTNQQRSIPTHHLIQCLLASVPPSKLTEVFVEQCRMNFAVHWGLTKTTPSILVPPLPATLLLFSFGSFFHQSF